MDAIRLGRSVRALRRARGWRQADLAAVARVSRTAISRVEVGRADRMSLHTIDTIATALGARLDGHLEWRGEGLDRLLDAAHARLVEAVVRWLDVVGWESAVEVSFSIYGERGSIDILALHRPTGSILVIEIKTVVPDIQAMLSALDRKARLAIRIAHVRGWPATRVSRLLVVREDRTARRHVQAAEATFRHAFRDRLVPLRAFIRSPEGREPISGLMFLPDEHQPVTRHRVGQSKGRSVA